MLLKDLSFFSSCVQSLFSKFAKTAHHYISLLLGYVLAGPIVGILSFYGLTELLVCSACILYNCTTGAAFITCLPPALIAGTLSGILSTLLSTWLNQKRLQIAHIITRYIAEPLYWATLGMDCDDLKQECPSYEEFKKEAQSCLEKKCLLTPLGRALTFGMRAANKLNHACYSSLAIDQAALLGNYLKIPF